MMLTPSFHLSQDDDYLTIHISAPCVKISETDIYFDDCYFKFICKPYFLRINLPGKVVCCEKAPVSYNVDKGTFTVHMQKLIAGQWFEGLELMTSYAPKGKPSTSASLIEVIGDPPCEELGEHFDWEIEQTPTINDESDTLLLAAISKEDLDLVELANRGELSLLDFSNSPDYVKAGQEGHNSSTNSSAACDAESLSLRSKGLNGSGKSSHHVVEISGCQNSDPSSTATVDTESIACCRHPQSQVVLQVPLDPTQDESENTSDSGSSTGSYSGSSCHTDSDDYSSSSSEVYSEDSDLESSCSSNDEQCSLLKKDQSYEKLR